MGFYYSTFLCYGKFVNKNNATVENEFEVDVSIDQAEWNAGAVPMQEIERCAPRWNIRVVDSEGTDLFMKQSCFCTLDVPPSVSCCYILVKRGAKFKGSPDQPLITGMAKALHGKYVPK